MRTANEVRAIAEGACPECGRDSLVLEDMSVNGLGSRQPRRAFVTARCTALKCSYRERAAV